MSEAVFDLSGRSVNRFDLYELAVQSCEAQVRFMRAVHGGLPTVFGDDFAGPAGLARAWLRLDGAHRAIATDADDAPLAHACAHAEGDGTLDRLTCRAGDVRTIDASEEADIIAACNFALCEMHERADLIDYLLGVRRRVRAGGVFVADLYGGATAHVRGALEVEISLFDEHGDETGEVLTYVWEQRSADPITARMRNAIHFELPSGERLENAFEYDWRLWTPAEVIDALAEAGFERAGIEAYDALGEAIDEEGEPMVRPIDGAERELGEEDAWVVYLAARQNP